MPANESLVGRAASGSGMNVNTTGFRVLRTELQLANKVFGEGLLAGVTELATGGSKVKAIWESIKWSTLARAGAGGFVFMATAAAGLAAGIRSIVKETGALQAAMDRMATSNKLQRNFEALLGSVSAAKARVSELYAFAASSKFEFSDIAAASRALTVLSNGVKGGLSDLQQLGKISAATSVPLEDLAGAVGQAGNAMRTGMDFSGSLEQLREMGVLTEGTVKQLQSMAIQGASTISIMDAFSASLEKTSGNLGETEKSIEDLEKGAAKAQETMMAAFGAPFVERHRKEVELTGKVYQNWTGILGNMGKLLATISTPFDNISLTAKEIASSKGFANLAGGAAMLAAAMIPVTAAWLALKGVGGLLGRGLAEFQMGGLTGLKNVVKGSVSPTARGADWAARAGRIRTAGGPEMAAQGAELLAKGWTKVGVGVEFLGKQLVRLVPWLTRLMAPMLALTAVTFVAEKAWELYNEEVEKAKRLSDMSESIKKDTAAMEARAKSLKTQDDYLQSLTDAQNRYNAALEEEAAIQGNVAMTEDDRHAAAAKTAIAAKDLRKVERQDTSSLGAGKEEVTAALRRAEIEKEIRDIIFSAQVARASDGEKAVLLAKKRAEFEEAAAGYSKSQAAAVDVAKAKTEYEGAGAVDTKRTLTAGSEIKRLNEEIEELRASEFTGVTSATAEGKLRNEEKRKELEKQLDVARQIEAVAQQGPVKEEKRAKYIEALEQGGKADRLEAAALREEGGPSPNQQKITALRKEADEAKLIENEQAKIKAADLRAESLANVRRMQGTGIAQAYAKQSLGVTSETYQAQDVLARQQQAQNTEQFAEATKYYRPEAANEEAKLAYKQQKTAVELENAQIQKGIDERARQLAIETAAFNASIEARKFESKAAQLAATGHYVAAAMQQKAAQDVVDKQEDLARAIELRAQGYSEDQVKEKVATQQATRAQERKATAEGRFGPEGTATRALKEKQLELASRGITVPGFEGPKGAAAKGELTKMQDADKLNATFQELMQGVEATPENIQKASDIAKDTTIADIAASAKPAGAGSMGDSMTRVGGGGGFYAGPSGDPMLNIAKRTQDIQALALKELSNMNEKGIILRGSIK